MGGQVVSELHKSRAVFRLPWFGDFLGGTTLARLWGHAAARVFSHAAWTAATAGRDVLFVGVRPDGRHSVLRRKAKGCVFTCVTSDEMLQKNPPKYQDYTDALLIPSQTDDVLFSFGHNSIYGPDSYWHFMLSLDTPLIHVSQISSTSSGLHQQRLTSSWDDSTCYDCLMSQWMGLPPRKTLYEWLL